ncbi:MAG: DUF5131 family protein [Caulobacteraceae bacterium]
MNKQGKDGIEWCDSTLNPVVGCTFGCPYCYARRMNDRFGWVENFNEPQFFPERLKKLNSKKSQNIFMDSMSDIADWNYAWTAETFKAMKKNPQHNYIFLTKRPQIYENWMQFGWENVWCGATGTDDAMANKANYQLGSIKGCNTFLSLEPLKSEICFLDTINADWIIIGQQTGPSAVPPKAEWVQSIINQCRETGVPVFVKRPLYEKFPIQGFPEGLK